MEIKPVKLIGERVKLFPMEWKHVGELFAAGQSGEIWRYLSQKVETVKDMEYLVQSALNGMETGLELPFVVYDTKSECLVGSTRFLNISIPNRNLEIGWTWYSPDVWRTRVNTETKYLLLRHSFETLGAVRVQLKADTRNTRSNQAIQRLGCTKEGVLRRDRILHDGYIRDANVFSIIQEEWPAIKARLEGFLVVQPERHL